MTRRHLIALAASAAAGAERDPFGEWSGLKLGMQLREGSIDQVYEETLKPYLQDSVLLDAPYPHIESTLKDGTKITLEFSSAATDRRLFAIHWNHGFSPPQEVKALRQSLEQRYGKPAWESTDPGAVVLGFPSAGRRDVKLSPAQLREFLFFGFQERAAILGVDFKGTVVTVVTHRSSVVRVVTEKLDYPLATTVLQP